MVRWEPGTPERLQEAALALFNTRGFDETTVAEIAESVGLTERTFFRHFADKRDVLFSGQELLTDAFIRGAAEAPADASPMQVVSSALRRSADFFADERRPHSRARQTVIDAHPALQEREQHKRAGIALTLGDALRARGVADPAAALVGQTGAIVFSTAFAQWLAPDESRSMADIQSDLLAQLPALFTP